MWVLALAAVLQGMLVAERFLFVLLCLLMGVPQTPTKRLAVCNTLSAAVMLGLQALLVPCRLAVRVCAVLWANAVLTLLLVVLVGVLAVVADMSGGFGALLLNLYNTGVGVTVQNEWIQPLAWGELLLGGLLPLWNLLVYLPRVLLRYVFIPTISLKPSYLRQMGGDSLLMTSALALSASNSALRMLECATWDATAESAAGLACIADTAYMHVDLMTPGVYLRNIMMTVEDVLVAGCTGGNLVLAAVMYPLLDFNTYKALHCVVNAVVQTVVAMPIVTVQRCRYAQMQAFSPSERTIMCMPDFSMSLSVLVSLVRALAQLLQNWADAVLIVVERGLGQRSTLCETDVTAQTINTMWGTAEGMLGRPQTVVPLTATLLAVTDGESTVYSSLAAADTWHAVGNWPLRVDVRAGVAPVRHSRELDGDDAASVRTGMLGCTCVDVLVDAEPAVRVQCATVPFRNTALVDFNETTLLRTLFYPRGAERLLTCGSMRLQVMPLRFSRKRMSRSYNTLDEGAWRILDAIAQGGQREPELYAADAAIYVQPECVASGAGGGAGGGACVGEVSCFPFCMGLHIAGQNGEAITLYNARSWRESVTVSQMDCVSMASVPTVECAAPVSSVSMAAGFDDAVCAPETECVASDAVVTRVPITNSSGFARLLEQTRVTQRLQAQPFVVAGDVLLFESADGLRVEVVRLFNTNGGAFVMQNEHLALGSATKGVETATCEVTSDAACYWNAVKAGKLVLPPTSASVAEGRSFPATASEWAVHWTHNPDNLLLEGFYDACQGVVATSFEFGAQRPRIWTLKTMRETETADEQPVAYMLVPDWVTQDTGCEQMANVQVTALHHINAQNVLVQVLRTTPRNFDYRAGTVRDPDPSLAKTVFFYLHPTQHGCTDPESPELIYTCWRTTAEGLFPDDTDAGQSVVLGSICPAARRTPSLGLALGETVVAGVETIRLVLDALFVLPAALTVDGSIERVFALRLDRPAFHSVLDTSGAQLLSPDAVMESLDRVSMYYVQTLLKLAALLQPTGVAQARVIRNIVVGTAKLLQHTTGVQKLQGQALQQWQILQATPLAQLIGGMQSNLVGMAAGPGGQRLSQLFSGMTSTLRVTVKLLQRVMLRILRGAKAGFALSNAGGVVGSVLADTFDDMTRGWFDAARLQCLGVADIFGSTTPVAVFFRDVCLSAPDGLQGMTAVILVLLLDYPSMRCACVLSASQVPAEVVREVCLQRELPAAVRATLKQIAGGAALGAGPDPVSLCFASMDAANTRLKRAFDPFFRRLYSAAAALGQSLDWVVAFWDEEAGECSNFESPYVVALVPEPSDYFMMCTDTSACRAKCLDEIEAFETAFAASQTAATGPQFVATQSITVNSKFFSISDIEAERHLAPFVVLALTELESCQDVCVDSRHVQDRCVVAAGLSGNELAVAYYCVPADIMRFVSAYAGQRLPVGPQYASRRQDERVDNVYLLTTDGVQRGRRDTLLVLSRSASSNYDRLELVQAGNLSTTLLQTQDAPFVGSMQSVQLVRVVPQQGLAPAHVMLQGQVFLWEDGEVRPRLACMRLSVDAWSEQMPSVTPSMFACADVFSSTHVDTCLLANCSRVLRLPLMHAIGRDRTLAVLDFDESLTRVLSRTEAPGAEQVAASLHMQKSQSVYRTMAHETAVNARHLAARSTARGDRVCVLMSGVVDRREAWLQNLCMNLSSGAVSVNPAEEVLEAVNIAVACELHGCAGCQSNPAHPDFADLQAKCFLASRCAVARCVGTAVNIRRPLCNMGALATGFAEEALLLSQGIWDAMSNSIVLAVELTNARRDVYVVTWPEQTFMAQVCHSKDMVLEATAVFTSIVGGADSKAEQHNYNAAGDLSAVLDARYHARRIMTTTAVTSLVSSILMAPIFAMLAVRKTVSCTVSDIFIVVDTLLEPVVAAGSALGVRAPRVVIGSKKFMTETSAVVGSCVTEVVHGLLRNIDSSEGLNGVGKYISELLGDITRMAALRPLEPIVHIFDATVSYMIGIITATESLLATVDWLHCRPPAAAMRDTSRCVCGDVAHSIPDEHKQETYASSAFWCSGPLLMTTAVGQEVLIWNPYSLEELLTPAEQFDTFILCMRTESNCPRPANLVLEEQGVELMQVVTQCRANYQARTWDTGAVFMGVLTSEEWQLLGTISSSALQAAWARTDDQYTGVRRRWARLSEYMRGFVLPDADRRCLRSALAEQLWQHSCLEQNLVRKGYASSFEYFVYEHSMSTRFASTDACQSFSGTAKPFADNGAAHAPSIWSSSSTNSLPVAEYHYMLSDSVASRADRAEQQLLVLHADIVATLREAAYTISSKVDVKAESREGDQLHQIMDCFMLGPYAAADMQATFELGGGGRLEVPQYHRGNPRSRQFAAGPATGGSDVRRAVMGRFLETIDAQVNAQVRDTVASTLNHWRSVMADIDNLRCECGDGPNSMACCRFASRADITYRARGLQLDTDIGDEVLQEVFQMDETQAVLQRLWTSTEFVPPSRPLSEADRIQLRNAYVFDFRQRVLEYSVDETPRALGNTSLWEQCTALLSAAFFTLPLRQGLLDDLRYDPTRDAGEGYLHGMEQMIERVLGHARELSPVFWTHVHRYVASDSVWCEDTTAEPAPHAPAARARPDSEWHGLEFGEEHILAPGLADVHFPADARCLCNWTAGSMCWVPSCELAPAPASDWPLLSAWGVLCSETTYQTRADLFLFLEVLQQHQLVTDETCQDVVPSVVWGLLDTRQQRAWYAGESRELGLDLQELASYGAAGMRLGLLQGGGPDDHTLLHFLQEHALLQPVRSYVNTKYRHTVAQPVCRHNLYHHLHSDLSQHFVDVFFPVAHSVHEAPVAAICSRWAVEFAVSQAMLRLRHHASNVTQAMLDKQADAAATWRSRCHVQLQQVGICALRGVLDLKPDGWDDGAQQCSFTTAEHGCEKLFYVTSGCLVMCDGVVYDPCLCAATVCVDIAFMKTGCEAGVVTDIRKWTDDPAVRLYSLHWPDALHVDETAGQAHWESMNAELLRIRQARASAPFVDDAALFAEVRTLVLRQAAGVVEGQPPPGFCDDVADYMPEDAQHPVGYHPTCACTREETNMRGFSSWMSSPVDAEQAWAVDPVRWRNMSSYSTVFGAAHLVCDAVAYSMDERSLNAYHLLSRWDPEETADPAVPLRDTADELPPNRMLQQGENPAQSERDHPCQPGQQGDAFLHSVGLVRDWFACYDSSECPTVDEWPHNPEPAPYTLPPGATADCAHPRLTRCRESSDCRVQRHDLVCQKAWDEATSAEEDEGICVHKRTCFQHAHCADGDMCAGTGECVRPKVYVHNELPTRVDVRLFSHDHATCELDADGFSSYQIVDDYAQAHGLCQFRNWFHFRSTVRNSTQHGLLQHVRLDRTLERTDDAAKLTLRERGVLWQAPHACDRSYQHTAMRICQAPRSRAWLTFNPVQPTNPIDNARSTRTWQDGEARFCGLAGKDRTGFLDPYRATDDSLKHVPSNIRLCREFEICQVVKFLVQGRAVEKRMTVVGPYQFADLEQCGAIGHLLAGTGDSAPRCVVDHLVVPLLGWVFSHTTAGSAIDELLPVDPVFRAIDARSEQWGAAAMQLKFDEMLHHCPSAFGRNLEEYLEYMGRLTLSYRADDAAMIDLIQPYANRLLLRVFGVDTDEPLATSRGFDSIDAYHQLKTCAAYVLERQHAVQDHVRSMNLYTSEQLWDPLVPGTSLYLFRGRAEMYVPFKWFWQCVIASRPADGGAGHDWLRQLEDVTDPEFTADTLLCANFQAPSTPPETETVQHKLQRSAALYDFEPDLGGALLHDIDAVLHAGLDAMQISIFPDTYCIGAVVPCELTPALAASSMATSTCTYKTGRNIEQDLDPDPGLPSPSSMHNIVRDARNVILGERFSNASDFFDANVNMFTSAEHGAPVEIIESIHTEIDYTWDYIPRLNFVTALQWLAGHGELLRHETLAVPYYDPVSGSCPDAFATPRERKGETAPVVVGGTLRRLSTPEFHVRADSNLLLRTQVVSPDIRFLSLQRALFFLVRYFVRAIQTRSSFRANSMTPTAQSQSQMFETLKQAAWTAHVNTAVSFADFMLTKQFACRDDRYVSTQSETNTLHRRLRYCVQELQEATGWQLDGASSATATTDGNVLQIDVPASVLLAGFMPTFSSSASGRQHLEELFSEDWALRVDLRLAVCSVDDRGAYVLNPYWAGMFDRVTGCDVLALGDPSVGIRSVDGECVTLAEDQTCGERFPTFDAALHGADGMPSICSEMFEAGTVFSPPSASALDSSYTPLCQRKAPRPAECDVQHGTLLNSHGTPVANLMDRHNVTTHAGVWSRNNPVMRETRARFPGISTAVAALRVLVSDIAGHALLFKISAEGQLRLQCMYMDAQPERACSQEASSLLARSAEFWTWQHRLLQKQWPADSAGASWRCPLAWLAAYGDATRPSAARTPSALRNQARFAGITDNLYAHPTVHSSDPMPFLRPGRFLSETRVCTDPDRRAASCRGASLLRETLAELRASGDFHAVKYLEDTTCVQLLDWPHQDYTMADTTFKEGNATEQRPCNVYGRLPRFALKRSVRRGPTVPAGLWPRSPSALSRSHSPAHACRMGRLPRVSVERAAPAQYCSVRADTLWCETWSNHSRARTSRPVHAATPDSRPKQPVTRRLRRCAACEDHAQGAFVDRRGASSVLQAARPQLSVGQATALHPARMIAQFLRRAACPRADGPCPALQALLTDDSGGAAADGAQAWLGRLLQAPVSQPPSSLSDEALWARPWGFCDQSAGPVESAERQRCSGHMSKAEWLNTSARAAQCAKMVTTADSVRSAPLELCLLDSTTEAMCRHMAEWRLKIDNIICQASGLAACPLYGFFYMPTRYNLENAQFVHDTVKDYYAALDQDCADASPATELAVQEQINKEALAQCAGLVIAPVKKGLQQLRQIVVMVIEILFYALQIAVEIMNLLVAVMTASSAALPAIATRIGMYIGLLLTAIGQAWLAIANAFFQMVFSDGLPRELVDLARALCNAMNWIHKYVVQKGVCVLLNIIVDICNGIANAFENIPLVGKAAATPFRGFASVLAGLSMCGESQLNCDALQTPQTDNRPSTLTYPTRCWSTYATFFGDTQSLSCSPADTCSPTLGQTSDPVMCAACPAVPAVQKFACAPETKLCTCSVAAITQSMCLSNEECAGADSNCRYLNGLLEPAAGSVKCSTCQTQQVCMLQPGQSTGFCACTLRHMGFARCRADQLGMDVFPEFGTMCLFSNALGTSSTYSVVVEDVMTRACDDLLASGAVCSLAAGRGYFVLGHATHGRRLLQERTIYTLSPLCKDALSQPGLPAVRATCERAYDLSVRTLQELGFSDLVPACALCSMEDAQQALRQHPQLAMRVLLHPGHAAAVLLRHTPLRHAHAVWHTMQDSVHVLAADLRDMLARPADMPPLLRRILRALNVTWNRTWDREWDRELDAHNTSNTSRNGPARRLLGTSSTSSIAGIKTAFEDMLAIGKAYQNQLNTGWDYVYPNLVTNPQYNPWLDKVWPPFDAIANPDGTCDTLRQLLETLTTTTSATAEAYRKRPPRPPNTLQWTQRATRPAPNSAAADGDAAGSGAGDDWLTRAMLWASRKVLGLVGLTPGGIYDFLVSVVYELLDAVHCDFEAVQTCSRWSLRLLNGLVLMGGVQALAVYVCFAFGLPLLGVASTVLYVPGVMWLCYGYSPTCLPLVPSCLVRDVVETLQDVVPNYILLPPSMLRPGCVMSKDDLFVHDDCIVPCDEPPFVFEDAGAVVAWLAAELRLVSWVDTALDYVPFLDVSGLRAQLWLKLGVATHGSSGLVLGHRICAAVSAYKVFPYLFLVALVVVTAVAVVLLLIDIGVALGALVMSLTVTVLTE